MSNQVINSIIASSIGTGLKQVEVFENLDFTTPSTGSAVVDSITLVQNVSENGLALKRTSDQIYTKCVNQLVRRDAQQAIAQVEYVASPATVTVGTEYTVSIIRTEAGIYEPNKKMYSVVAVAGETQLSLVTKLATNINKDRSSSGINATALNTAAGFAVPTLIINNTIAYPMRTYTVIASNMGAITNGSRPSQGVGTYDLVVDVEDTSKVTAGVQKPWFAGPYNNPVYYAENVFENATAPVVAPGTNLIPNPTFTGLTTVNVGTEIVIGNVSYIKLATIGGNTLLSDIVAAGSVTPAIKTGYTTIIINATEFRNEYLAVSTTAMPKSTILFVRDDSTAINDFVTKLEGCLGKTAIIA